MPTIDFDPTAYEPWTGGYKVFTPGKYEAAITASEIFNNKKETGMILKLTWSMLGQEFRGREINEFLNIRHYNEKAEQIAMRKLSAIALACGKKDKIQESEELHNIPCVLEIETEEKEGKINNWIKSYSAGTRAPASPTSLPNARPSAPPPWGRK